MDPSPIGDFFGRIGDVVSWLPNWAISLIIFVLAVAIAIPLHKIAFSFLMRLASRVDAFWQSLLQQTRGPSRLGVITLALSAAATISPLSERETEIIRHILLICFLALLGWVARTALEMWTQVYLRRYRLDTEDNLLARKHVTQTRILLRVADVLIMIVAVSAVLMTFDQVRQYGVSLLASAGAAGLVIGLALQPVLKNLFAGIQLAVTQPIRIDDALIVEGEWGNVEEITSTYVVVRIWDWRRLILPLSYFIEKPFQNWTREGSALIGNVMIYLDYSVPVDAVREKVQEIAAGSPLWDGKVVAVQVTDFRERVMEVRVLVSASNAGRAFDLRCEMREKLIAYINAEYPEGLPRVRADASVIPDKVMRRALLGGRDAPPEAAERSMEAGSGRRASAEA